MITLENLESLASLLRSYSDITLNYENDYILIAPIEDLDRYPFRQTMGSMGEREQAIEALKIYRKFSALIDELKALSKNQVYASVPVCLSKPTKFFREMP